MKKFIFCSLLGVILCAAAAAQPLKKSEIITDTVQSTILGEEVPVNVFLPAGFDKDGGRQYPVIYLLHGRYGTNVDWATTGHMKNVVDELIASGELRDVVILMPCAGHNDIRNVQNGYFNMPGRSYEDFFFQELVPTLEKRYHIIGDKQHRAIMGLSMGGGGSTVYSQRHPDMFSSCYSMSGWLDEDEQPEDAPKDKLYIVRKSVHEHSAIAFVENADEETVAKLKTVKWFFDCGDDDYLLKRSVDIHFKMNEKGIKNELRVRDGWHSWEYWHTALRLALPFASRNFAK